jgi:hypothetical protein
VPYELEHVTPYVVEEPGVTEIVPEVAPPVEKLLPVHDDAPVEDQLKLAAFPTVTGFGFTERDTPGTGETVVFATTDAPLTL